MKNYTQTVSVAADKEKAFEALTMDVIKWWGKTNHSGSREGDVFKVSFGEAFWTFKVIRLQKPEKISWECIEANQVHKGLENMGEEWLGTILHWKITQKEDQLIDINFVHEGLVPEFACYEVCSSAWDFFVLESLKNYLETGTGQPAIR